MNLQFYLAKELIVIIIASLPVIELRGAIPIGISLGLSPLNAAVLSFIGSIIPIPIVIFGTRPIFNYLKRTAVFRSLIKKISTNVMKNSSKKIQKYGIWGLVIFVAIPLPGTGVWSGSLAAALLDIRFKKAFPAILLGNLIAGVIIFALSNGFVNVIIK